ncbi:MAG: membrane bound O-acyl transferase family-domain-containing protein [Opitutaceae bacterium]|nr:membrane bound O-acyl transferase family-domain-containing protein [Opitutaceae bacterium]
MNTTSHEGPAWPARAAGWAAGIAAVALAWWLVRERAGWVVMLTVAGAEWAVLKLATFRSYAAAASWPRAIGYLTAWPGMNARAFFGAEAGDPADAREFGFAVAKTLLGLALVAWAVWHAHDEAELLVAWVAVVGVLFTLHFGGFHLVSCAWRAAGVDAPPIMRAPIAATSLAELWGARWNLAFADAARRFVLKPLARPIGGRTAGLAVFVVSGLVHESVVSLPARGGWGGPTAYFLLQAAGLAIERSERGVRCGLGRGAAGRLWTLFVAVAPLPLLFHAPFARNVIVPLFRGLAAFLP